MKRAGFVVVIVAAFAAASARGGDEASSFRYTRTLSAPRGGGPVAFEPDGALLGHARVGLADLRIADASGDEVPWRPLPGRTAAPRRVTVLNTGTRAGAAVALVDLGPRRAVHDRLNLDIRQRGFVARVTVDGADRRAGPFTRLGATTIYDVAGARRARSTEVVFSPTDFRYLSLTAKGVRAIAGASVAASAARTRFVERPASMRTSTSGRHTDVVLDLGYPHVPVSELRVSSATRLYERPVEIAGSADGTRFATIGYGRIAAFPGSNQGPLDASLRVRFVRVRIENGDDPPLRDVRVRAFDVSHAVLVRGGRPLPYTLRYGNQTIGAPSYDFARLPAGALELARLRHGSPGAETANPSFRAPPDKRSFFARHDWLVKAALALGAIAVGAAGLLALRRPR